MLNSAMIKSRGGPHATLSVWVTEEQEVIMAGWPGLRLGEGPEVRGVTLVTVRAIRCAADPGTHWESDCDHDSA